jgi:hypothetical protein
MTYHIAVEAPTPGEYLEEWLHRRNPVLRAQNHGLDPVSELTLCGRSTHNLTIRKENWEKVAADRRCRDCSSAFTT